MPTDDQIESDLVTAARWLRQLYMLEDEGLYVPGNAPGIADGLSALNAVTRPQQQRPRMRLTAEENKAIERHAVDLVDAHFTRLGYVVVDVGSTESYDLHATRCDEVLMIEVKGTTSDGSEIILTANEAALHEAQFPNTALAVVRNIIVQRQTQPPYATGGDLLLETPWKPESSRLQAIAYKYCTGL